MPTKHYKALRPDLSKGRGEQASYSPQCYRALRLIAREVSLSLFLSRDLHRGTGRAAVMTSRERHLLAEVATRRRGGLHQADDDRRVGQALAARRDLAIRRVSSRAWLNGREVGG